MPGRVRTRFGPSPTGALHVGGLRTALFNCLLVRRHGGEFVLRIEDTDTGRTVEGSEKALTEDLAWAGLSWDEGPDKGGPYGPYRQSERLATYRAEAERLLGEGLAYHCYCTRERLAGLKDSQRRSGLPPRYDGACRALKRAPHGVEPVVRFRVEANEIHFTDLVHGPMTFSTSAFGDFVIIGSDGVASYNFATAVDDAMMEITHVVRGDDHLSNTPRQILVARALGHTPPAYAHTPLVLGPDRTPLGKRHEDASVRVLKEKGFLPDAVLNAVARLGWAPGDGLLTLAEMAGRFALENTSKSPSVFDQTALKAFNREAISALAPEELLGLVELGPGCEPGDALKALAAVQSSAGTLLETEELAGALIGPYEPTSAARAVMGEEYASKVIRAFAEELERAGELDAEAFKAAVKKAGERTGEKGLRLYLPIRCALTGRTEGIGLAEAAVVIGRARAITRIKSIKG